MDGDNGVMTRGRAAATRMDSGGDQPLNKNSDKDGDGDRRAEEMMEQFPQHNDDASRMADVGDHGGRRWISSSDGYHPHARDDERRPLMNQYSDGFFSEPPAGGRGWVPGLGRPVRNLWRGRGGVTHQRREETDSSPDPEEANRGLVYDDVPRDRYSPKIPVFLGNGKETWEVWYNRFSDIAQRQRWDANRMLDELLPKLQGPAGEFVYGQLTYRTRQNIISLVAELKSRFRKIETSKNYGAMFSNRCQKPHESVEEYAADLKRLYDKAHANRDHVTRREDLLRRFLDGLVNDQARFHVEFIKDPNDIDEAAFEVVNFIDTRQRTGGVQAEKNKRVARRLGTTCDDTDEDVDSDMEIDVDTVDLRVARLPKQSVRPQPKPATTTVGNLDGSKGAGRPSSDSDLMQELKAFRADVKKSTDDLQDRVGILEFAFSEFSLMKYPYKRSVNDSPGQGNRPSRRYNRSGSSNVAPGACYKCGQMGHFIRDCGVTVNGQFHISPQPMAEDVTSSNLPAQSGN
jgi:hypothetical protein